LLVTRSFTFRALLGCMSASVMAGCATSAPQADVGSRIARATGSSTAIVFQTKGEELNATETSIPTLTLAEAVRRTLLHDPETQAAIARVRSAQADAKQNRLLPNPVLNVALRFPEGGGSTVIEAGLAADFVTVLSRRGRTSAADNRLRGASAEAVSRVLDVLTEVRETYVAVQTLDALVTVLQERVGIIDRLLELARSRVRNGFGTPLDVLTLEAQRLELETEVADLELERREARLTLTRLIGEPSGAMQWRVETPEANPPISAPESRWIALALEHRPEVQAAQYEMESLGAEFKLTRFAPFDGGEVGIDAERDDGDWTIGPAASVPIPLFDFGQARRERARAAVIEARHKLTAARRLVVQETRQAHGAFTASLANLERVRGRLVPLLENRLAQAESQFKAGRTDVTGLLLAEQELRAGQTRSVELQRSNTEALIRLQRAVGGPGIFASLESEPTTVPTATTTLPTTQPGPMNRP
jgi:outer membrane protein TolC